MNAIENLINDMISDKIYRRTLRIKEQSKTKMFLTDVTPYIDNKQLRIETHTDRIDVFLGPESLKLI